jgi:hypothetical protein
MAIFAPSSMTALPHIVLGGCAKKQECYNSPNSGIHMNPETQRSVSELRADNQARKVTANKAWQALKFRELVKDLPAVELTHNSLPKIPSLVKPRIR